MSTPALMLIRIASLYVGAIRWTVCSLIMSSQSETTTPSKPKLFPEHVG